MRPTLTAQLFERAVAPFLVSRIASKASQTTGQLVKVAIADGVHLVVASVKGEDLPAQATSASIAGPTLSLLVEDGDGNVSRRSVQICEHVRREAGLCCGYGG